MLAQKRRDAIAAMLKENGAVIASDLVERLGVSLETVRRDLLLMEQQGRLSRVHGGAVEKRDMRPLLGRSERDREQSRNKRELSAKAASFVSEGDIIGIDSGSTAKVFAEVLSERFNRLTVVTHSMDVIQKLSEKQGFDLLLCGGRYYAEENAFYGALTLSALQELHVQKAFVFPSAVSLEGGIGDFQDDFAQIQKAMIRIADEVYVLADSSKFEAKALLKLSEMKKDYRYVTDHALSEELLRLYRENDIDIH